MAVTFAIFGSSMALGLAGLGVMKLVSKQRAAAGEYKNNLTRHNREERLLDKFDGKDTK